MSSAKDIASGFTITGLLDQSTKTRQEYPIVEIAINDITDHPGNTIYSMDEKGIESLASSIREQGLTDLPLVRKMDDGTFQMLSGHRRKAAYALLAKTDDSYSKIPCRVIERIDDDFSVMILHAANYFTRSLSITERAAATRALGIEVERRRAQDASLSGVRTEDVKAAIIHEQTGRKVSGKTIKRQEALAELVETRLIDAWRDKAEAELLSASCIEALAELPEAAQILLFDRLPDNAVSKASITKFIGEALDEREAESKKVSAKRELAVALREKTHPHTDTRLTIALSSIRSYLENPPEGTQEPDLKASSLLRCLSGHLPKPKNESRKTTENRLRHVW